jgi:hypothetical protein
MHGFELITLLAVAGSTLNWRRQQAASGSDRRAILPRVVHPNF